MRIGVFVANLKPDGLILAISDAKSLAAGGTGDTDMEAIAVRPGPGLGWMLDVNGIENSQHFRTGAQAESAAKDLAGRLSDAGQGCEIVIFLRDGTVGGRFVASAVVGA